MFTGIFVKILSIVLLLASPPLNSVPIPNIKTTPTESKSTTDKILTIIPEIIFIL